VKTVKVMANSAVEENFLKNVLSCNFSDILIFCFGS
jgi:hypothetical protein